MLAKRLKGGQGCKMWVIDVNDSRKTLQPMYEPSNQRIQDDLE